MLVFFPCSHHVKKVKNNSITLRGDISQNEQFDFNLKN